MNTDPLLERATPSLDRLAAITWDLDLHSEPSYLALMGEYLRRMALWVAAAHLPESGPFFDLAAALIPDAALPAPLREAISTRVKSPSGMARTVCEWYVHWALVCDQPAISGVALPNPYDPLIRIYERNGTFRREDRFVDVGMAGIALTEWRRYAGRPPLPALDDATLDALDRAAAGTKRA